MLTDRITSSKNDCLPSRDEIFRFGKQSNTGKFLLGYHHFFGLIVFYYDINPFSKSHFVFRTLIYAYPV